MNTIYNPHKTKPNIEKRNKQCSLAKPVGREKNLKLCATPGDQSLNYIIKKIWVINQLFKQFWKDENELEKP